MAGPLVLKAPPQRKPRPCDRDPRLFRGPGIHATLNSTGSMVPDTPTKRRNGCGVRSDSEEVPSTGDRTETVLILVAVLLAAGFGTCFGQGTGEVDLGLQALSEGKTDRAIELWTRAIARNPKNYAAHVNRGTAYLRTGFVLRGIIDWHRASELSPVFAYGVHTGGFVRQAAGNAAMLNYAASLELDPDYAASVVMMGAAYQDFGWNREALEMYRKSADLTKNPLLKSHFEYWVESLEGKPLR
jgi:hypothetical protein